MRKIDLSPYNYKNEEVPPRDLLVQVINSGTHTPTELFKRIKLAEKIDKAEEAIFLESGEWDTLKIAIDALGAAFTPAHAEFLHRIYDAPNVEVQEKV